MKPPLIVILVFLAGTGSSRSADEWIGLEPEQPVLIGVELGEDEADDSSRALILGIPFGESAGYYGYYSETRLSEFDQKFDSLVLATTLWYRISELVDIEIQHFFEGDEGELEKETLGITLGLDQGDWDFRLHFDSGETLLFTNGDARDFTDSVPDRFASDVTGYGLSLGWQVDPWYWQASFKRYDYELDLTRLNQSLIALLVLKPSALAQSSLLITQNAALVFGHADFDDDYSVLIAQDRSAIDESYDESLVLSWQHWASPRFAYLLTASMPVPAESIGITLGLRWVL